MNPEFSAHIDALPNWLHLWVMWMVVINLGAIVFTWKKVEARWVVGAFLVNVVFMSFLFDTFGWVRLLGLSHVVMWTPLLVYIWRRRNAIDRVSLYGKYIVVLFATNAASLVVDYIDVARYMLGDSALG